MDPIAVVEPYVPAGQSVQDPDPAREYFPAGHRLTVSVVDAAGHA